MITAALLIINHSGFQPDLARQADRLLAIGPRALAYTTFVDLQRIPAPRPQVLPRPAAYEIQRSPEGNFGLTIPPELTPPSWKVGAPEAFTASFSLRSDAASNQSFLRSESADFGFGVPAVLAARNLRDLRKTFRASKISLSGLLAEGIVVELSFDPRSPKRSIKILLADGVGVTQVEITKRNGAATVEKVHRTQAPERGEHRHDSGSGGEAGSSSR